ESITTPAGEKVAIITGGVNVIVQGLSTDNLPQVLGPLGDVDIEADRVVIWGADLSGLNGAAQDNNAPLQIYMEGNIIFRQGDRTVYADQMFYDVPTHRSTILNAELLTPVPQRGAINQYTGLVRLRAAAMHQLDESHFLAQDALFTTSRLEVPTYAL